MSKERESIESAIETPSRRVKRSAASVLQEGAAAAPGEPAQARGRLLNTSSGIVSTASTASTISTGRGGLVAGGRGGGRPGMLGVVHMMGPGGTMMMQQPQTQHQPNTSTPCAACKLLRRRCAQECPFAPYFSPHEPQRFASVHKIYGASNVSKMLMEVPESQRADAANSLVYEANARIRDPVYGCMGVISTLQQQAQALQAELSAVRAEVMRYRAAAAASTAAHHVEATGVVHVLAPPYPDHPHPHHPHHPAHQRPGGPDQPGHGPFAAAQPSTSQQQPPSASDTKDRFWP